MGIAADIIIIVIAAFIGGTLVQRLGQPLLLGPGTIHVAHTLEERVPKKQLTEAVELYQKLVKQLKTES